MLEKSVFENSVKLGNSVILCFEILDQGRQTAFGKDFFKWSVSRKEWEIQHEQVRMSNKSTEEQGESAWFSKKFLPYLTAK